MAAALHALRTAAFSAREGFLHAATRSADEAHRERHTAAADRLADSVLRPLDAALGSPPRTRDDAGAESPTLWDLA